MYGEACTSAVTAYAPGLVVLFGTQTVCPVDGVQVAPVVGHVQTAAPLAHALGKSVEILPGLREIETMPLRPQEGSDQVAVDRVVVDDEHPGRLAGIVLQWRGRRIRGVTGRAGG